MKQEDKELLLKDLCARLPYGVKVNITSKESKNRVVDLTVNNICHLTSGWWSECKPYLFPLSSMTEEQKQEFNSYFADVPYYGDNGHEHVVPYYFVELLMEFFHKNHIDNNGLIPKGLANDATGLNIY